MIVWFPTLNASLNALSGILIVLAFIFVHQRRWRAHGYTMVAATAVSAVFLACYLTYHALEGEKSTKTSHAPHWLRDLYLLILLPHLLLAIIMLPMIAVTLWRAYNRQWARHKRMSVPTFWVWLYVSVTGVIVYWMLYHTTLVS